MIVDKTRAGHIKSEVIKYHYPKIKNRLKPVSYTHLDVYKRQLKKAEDGSNIFPKHVPNKGKHLR